MSFASPSTDQPRDIDAAAVASSHRRPLIVVAAVLVVVAGIYVFSQAGAAASSHPDVEHRADEPVEVQPRETASFDVVAFDDSGSVSISQVDGPGTLSCSGPGVGDESCTYDWTPSNGDIGTHEAVFEATDNDGLTDQTSATIEVTGGDPSISQSADDPEATSPGETVGFGVSAVDNEGREISVTKVSGPGSLTCGLPEPHVADCSFGWTPDEGDVGTHEVTFRVTNDFDQTDQTSVTIEVSDGDEPPQIGHDADEPVQVAPGETASFNVLAADDSGSVSISQVGGPGDSLDCSGPGRLDEECAYTWTPGSGDEGTHEAVFEAKDGSAQTDQTSVTIEVSDGGGGPPEGAPVDGISSTSGSVSVWDGPPPASLKPHELEQNNVVVFREPGGLVTSPLRMNATQAGRYDSFADLTPGNRSSSTATPVDSVLLHFDPEGEATSSVKGRIDFNREVLGIVLRPNALDASATSLGFTNVDYPQDGDDHHLELDTNAPGLEDSITLSSDRRGISFDFSAGPAIDQARVILRSEKGYWQVRALQAAGISDSNACIDSTIWDPSEGFQKNKGIVKSGYGYYRDAFKEDNRTVWSATARLAGHGVWWSLRTVHDIREAVEGPYSVKVDGQRYTYTVEELETVEVEFLSIQKSILCDLAWQHEAFLQAIRDGKDELAYLEPALKSDPSLAAGSPLFGEGERRVGPEDLIAAWRDVADEQEVAPALYTLVVREQGWAVAQPHWKNIRDTLGNSRIPHLLKALDAAPSPTGGRTFWGWSDGQSIAELDARLSWAEAEVIPPFFANLYRSGGLLDAENLADKELPCLVPWQLIRDPRAVLLACELLDVGEATTTQVAQDETVAHLVRVSDTVDQLSIDTTWGGSDVVTTLRSPSGRSIYRDTEASDVEHTKTATSEAYTVRDPEAGPWVVELTGADVPDGGEETGLSIEGNRKPSADAKGPTKVLVGEEISLDASGSSDPDGTIASYAWDLDDDGEYDDGTGASAKVTFDTVGTFSVGLQVTDDSGTTSTDTVEVAVENAPPEVEDAGDVTVDEGATAANTGTFSDPGPDDVTVTASVGTISQDSSTDGNWDWTFDAVDGPEDSQTVTITAQDAHGAEASTTFDVTVNNVAPTITEINGNETTEAPGETGAVRGEFTDPGEEDEHTVTVEWGDGTSDTVTLEVGERGFNLTHDYRDDNPSGTPSDDYAVNVTVADDDDGSDTDEATVTVDNVAPDLGEPRSDDIAEAEAATVSVQFVDPGVDDTHQATVDWGDGTSENVEVERGIGIPEKNVGLVEASHVYGDDGDYPVTVTVVDDDTGQDTATTRVSVANLDPSVALDTTGAVAFPGEEAFLGRAGSEQAHAAEGDDAGSDDLTFAWSFDWRSGSAKSASTTYFNDTGDPSGSPDPDLSPQGTFPFTASDTTTFTPSRAGVADVTVELADDDGGADIDGLVKLVTGDRTCTRGQGFWKHQTSDKGQQHVDETTLTRYLAVANVGSSVFSEVTAAATIDEANDVLWTKGPSMRDKAEAQLLAAWLNVSGGAVGWTDDVDGRTVGERLADAEAILGDSEATHQELEQAKDLAEAINLHEQDNPDCDGGGDDDQGGGPPPKNSGNGNGNGQG